MSFPSVLTDAETAVLRALWDSRRGLAVAEIHHACPGYSRTTIATVVRVYILTGSVQTLGYAHVFRLGRRARKVRLTVEGRRLARRLGYVPDSTSRVSADAG
jgi:hypothetical protein